MLRLWMVNSPLDTVLPSRVVSVQFVVLTLSWGQGVVLIVTIFFHRCVVWKGHNQEWYHLLLQNVKLCPCRTYRRQCGSSGKLCQCHAAQFYWRLGEGADGVAGILVVSGDCFDLLSRACWRWVCLSRLSGAPISEAGILPTGPVVGVKVDSQCRCSPLGVVAEPMPLVPV